jgi:hypothetical protein
MNDAAHAIELLLRKPARNIGHGITDARDRVLG